MPSGAGNGRILTVSASACSDAPAASAWFLPHGLRSRSCPWLSCLQELLQQLESPEAIRQERLRLFREAAFGLHVEEHFSRSKRDRDRIIYSMLRCRSLPRLEELALAIREGDIDFAAAAIRFSEGPESAQGGRIGPISPDAGHPELKRRWLRPVRGI